MKKLKIKLFFTILSIFTLFILTILIFVNYQNYQIRKENIMSTLIRMSDDDRRINDKDTIPNRPMLEEPENGIRRIFLDRDVYTIKLSDNGDISEFITHTEYNVNENIIKNVAEKIIKNHKENLKVGNLYLTDYSYSFSKDGYTLTIVSNIEVRKELSDYLLSSLLVFILLEFVVIFISRIITKWIIKPVIESFDKQSRFVADASHELKTPISVILASISAYEKDNNKKWITNIKNESDRMSNLITNLLDLASLENSKKVYESHNFSKLIESTVLTFESILFDENIKLEYNIKEDINLNCDSYEIKQMMSILLDNAIKHSSGKKKIIIDLTEEKDKVILTVKNRGKPIKKEDESRIFERFYRVDESRNRDDNRYGLGLAIAKKIVENHNGKISASSKEGFTKFSIVLNRQK